MTYHKARWTRRSMGRFWRSESLLTIKPVSEYARARMILSYQGDIF